MSVVVFPFVFSRPGFSEIPEFSTRMVQGNEGSEQRAAEFGDDYLLKVTGALRFPQPSVSKTIADFFAFVIARLGKFDEFLYSPFSQYFRVVTSEAIGTGDASNKVFTLLSKHVNASTLVVKDNGVTKTLTADYTFSGNDSAPTVTFVSAPSAGHAITASYERYYPVRFDDDSIDLPFLTSVAADVTRAIKTPPFSIVGTGPGGHLA